MRNLEEEEEDRGVAAASDRARAKRRIRVGEFFEVGRPAGIPLVPYAQVDGRVCATLLEMVM